MSMRSLKDTDRVRSKLGDRGRTEEEVLEVEAEAPESPGYGGAGHRKRPSVFDSVESSEGIDRADGGGGGGSREEGVHTLNAALGAIVVNVDGESTPQREIGPSSGSLSRDGGDVAPSNEEERGEDGQGDANAQGTDSDAASSPEGADDVEYTRTYEEGQEYSEGVIDQDAFDFDSDVDGEHDPMLHSHELLLERRRQRIDANRERTARETNAAVREPLRNADGRIDYRNNWLVYYHSKDDSFFDSQEARMELCGTRRELLDGSTRAMPYNGAAIDENNNLDMYFSFTREFNGTRNETYHNYKIFAGQLLRVAIAWEKIRGEEAWRPGALFSLASNCKLWDTIMMYFEEKCTAGTVRNKGQMGLKIVNCAYAYYVRKPKYPTDQFKNKRFLEKLGAVQSLLRGYVRKNKKESRREKAFSKEVEARADRRKLLTEDDILELRDTCIGKLRQIVRHFQNRFQDCGARDVTHKIAVFAEHIDQRGFIKKWMLNFTAMLLLFGNGQRNQVYTFLKAPSLSDLDEIENEEKGSFGTVPLKLQVSEHEKRPRDAGLASILYSPEVCTVMRFHVSFVLPHLHKRHTVQDGGPASKLLLLDTRNGRPVTSDQIRKTLTAFIRFKDPESRVTPMDLRAAYATYTIKRFVAREEEGNEMLKNMTEDQFINMLAAVMNTGVEQIRNAYAAATHEEYATNVARMMGICNVESSSDYLGRKADMRLSSSSGGDSGFRSRQREGVRQGASRSDGGEPGTSLKLSGKALGESRSTRRDNPQGKSLIRPESTGREANKAKPSFEGIEEEGEGVENAGVIKTKANSRRREKSKTEKPRSRSKHRSKKRSYPEDESSVKESREERKKRKKQTTEPEVVSLIEEGSDRKA